jgi:hypothetical protein
MRMAWTKVATAEIELERFEFLSLLSSVGLWAGLAAPLTFFGCWRNAWNSAIRPPKPSADFPKPQKAL